MSAPTFHIASPPGWFFKFPPSIEPQALPPKSDGFTIANPFNINPTLYQNALSMNVPITFAIGYMTFVSVANVVNKRRKYRAWAISKTPAFYILTLLHNILLAVYSGITCAAMIRALKVSLVSPVNKYGISGTLDSLCKMNGPRGLGDAMTYNPTSSVWGSKNPNIHLGTNGLPDSTDVGRIWNEGLGFWGWIFYLSKFYEVVDTLIILAKGKRSATLQTYHHAGAMLCMWAGIRYMSPPIWMFALVNAGIHTLMYTYYTLSTLGIKVPPALKQTLTTMQILQFLVGVVFAGMHFFVEYSVPVSVSYSIVNGVANAATTAARSASSLTHPSTASAVAASATGAALPWFQKIAAWAAGSPGVAHNVHNNAGELFGFNNVKPLEEIRQHTQYQNIHCLDTSGQAFAIWLNVGYLAPLTGLFIRFFIKSYVFGEPRATRSDKKQGQGRRLSTGATNALKETSRSVEAIGRQVEDTIDFMGGEVKDGGENLTVESDLREALRKLSPSNDADGNAEEAVEEEEEEEVEEPEEVSEPTEDENSSGEHINGADLADEDEVAEEDHSEGDTKTEDAHAMDGEPSGVLVPGADEDEEKAQSEEADAEQESEEGKLDAAEKENQKPDADTNGVKEEHKDSDDEVDAQHAHANGSTAEDEFQYSPKMSKTQPGED